MPPLLNVSSGQVVTVATVFQASQLVGTGRFSEVYRAFDSVSQTDVALKLYRGSDQESHTLAKNEQQALTKIGQANTEYFPRLRRAARHRINNANHPLLVLELGSYVDQQGTSRIYSLREVIAAANHGSQKALLPDSSFWQASSLIRWLIDLVQAVHELHKVGMIHRDLKPENILIKRPAGLGHSLPFLLDFNSTTTSGDQASTSATPRYLPPEARSGQRKNPSTHDDLWALASIVAEVLFKDGEGKNGECKSIIQGEVPEPFCNAIRKGLELRVEDRYETALDMLSACELALSNVGNANTSLGVPLIGSEEYAVARSAMERIRGSIEEALAPAGEIVIPKEVEEQVSILFSWLHDESTQSLDLTSELIRLGPTAIPCCLQQGFRLRPDSASFKEVLKAIKKLAEGNLDIVRRSLDLYSLSSNVGVRRICRELCKEIEMFPEVLLDSLNNDDGILLPKERLELAAICMDYSDNSSSILALSTYMCREYVLDPKGYLHLRDGVARKMGRMKFAEKALLIVEDTKNCIWEEIPEFSDIPPEQKPEIEKGLVELMADAFASMGDAALDVFKSGRVPRTAGDRIGLRVYRRFAFKLAERYQPAREWFVRQSELDPLDKDLAAIAGKKKEHNIDYESVFQRYLDHKRESDYNDLRFSHDLRVFNAIGSFMEGDPDGVEVADVLQLLKGFQSRQRTSVVKCLLKYWGTFAEADYDLLVKVLSRYDVHESLRPQAISRLSADLGGERDEIARHGLEILLR